MTRPKLAKTQRKMLCLTFPPELIQFLDSLAWDLARESGCAHRLDRMTLLRGLVRAFRKGKFDVSGIHTEDEFVKSVLAQIRERKRRRVKTGRK